MDKIHNEDGLDVESGARNGVVGVPCFPFGGFTDLNRKPTKAILGEV